MSNLFIDWKVVVKMDSNIAFSSNVYKFKPSGKEDPFYPGPIKAGDKEFLSKILDYDSLYILKNSKYMGGSGASHYYYLNKSQIDILDPNFVGNMMYSKDKDPEIEEDNKKKDAEYGYDKIKAKRLFPLITELRDDKDESNINKSSGKWVKKQSGDNDDTTIYEFIGSKNTTTNTDTKSNKEEILPEIDPYYDIYDGFKPKKDIFDQDDLYDTQSIADEYVHENGSMFTAFEEVEQKEIIMEDYRKYLFVNAGPGTGKTYTLLHKLENMIDVQGVDPETIVVLCFTNAAVKEIKDRMLAFAEKTGNRQLINVDARTFHSFSWWLLQQANDLFIGSKGYKYIDYTKLSYDESIDAAIRIIRLFGEEIFEGWSHFIVDEIQDLTDERALLVLKMVEQCIKNNVGVTLCGDSCQAIYDYEQDHKKSIMTSERFYMCLFRIFYEKAQDNEARLLTLTYNHRQVDELEKISIGLRNAILSGNVESMQKETIKIVKSLENLEPKRFTANADVSQIKLLHDDGTACFMCRNNAQALVASTNLRKRWIKHIVNAYEDSKYYAGWLGKVFGEFEKPVINFEEFCILANKYCDMYSPEELWERLQDLVGSKNNVLKISEIMDIIRKAKKDDPHFRNIQKGSLVVSNIHRAKGREYDRVILEHKYADRLCGMQQKINEYKTFYVAITRPKKKLFLSYLSGIKGARFKEIWKTNRKRWLKFTRDGFTRFEVRGYIDSEQEVFKNNLHYIINNISVGDEIKLIYKERTKRFFIVHCSNAKEIEIGITSSALIDDMKCMGDKYGLDIPDRIEELYVSGIYTDFTSDGKMYCWVDYSGLGLCKYDAY